VRKSLGSLAALVLLLAILGWSRGWYVMGRLPSAEGHSAFRVDVDRGKVGQDVVAVARWFQRLLLKREHKGAKEAGEPPAEGAGQK
jgi:hypothetical protein